MDESLHTQIRNEVHARYCTFGHAPTLVIDALLYIRAKWPLSVSPSDHGLTRHKREVACRDALQQMTLDQLLDYAGLISAERARLGYNVDGGGRDLTYAEWLDMLSSGLSPLAWARRNPAVPAVPGVDPGTV